jgi:hypothetical protein
MKVMFTDRIARKKITLLVLVPNFGEVQTQGNNCSLITKSADVTFVLWKYNEPGYDVH